MYICFVPFKFGEKIEDTTTIYKQKRVGSRDEYLDTLSVEKILAVTSVEALQQ
jgi:hypothetical protein